MTDTEQCYIKSAVIKAEQKYTTVSILCDAVITVFFLLALLLQIISVAQVECDLFLLYSLAVLLPVIMFLSCFSAKFKPLFYAVPVLCIILLAVIFNLDIINGFNAVINGFLNSWGSVTASIMPQFNTHGASAAAATAFLLTVTAVALLPLSLCIRNNIFIIPSILLLLVLLFSCYVQRVNILGLMLALTANTVLFYKCRIHSENSIQNVSGKLQNAVTVIPVVLLLVFLFIAVLSLPSSDFSNVKDNLQKTADNIIYGSSQPLPQGDFNNLHNYSPQGKEQLRVVMSTPQSYYLRGYVGSVYTEKGWQQLNNLQLYKSSSLFYWLHKDNFYGYNQLSVLADTVGSNIDNRIIINNTGACAKYMYIPYEVNGFENKVVNYNLINDANPFSSSCFGAKIYTYSAASNMVKQYTTLSAQLYSNINSSESAIKGYVNNEAHYNEFVYDNYLQIPGTAKNTVESILGEYKTNGTHLSYTSAKQSILNCLTSGMQYSTTVNAPSNNDFVTAFLQENRQGYSVHFATAATLMFRYYGIPARYVEGYLITPEDVKDVLSNSEIIIDDTHAHAWTEFYCDGVGWIPFETTPPYLNVMEQAEELSPSNPQSDNNSQTGNNSTDTSDNSTEQQEPSNNALKQADSNILTIFFIAVFILFTAVIIMVFVILIKRRKRLNKIYKSFKINDNKNAVLNQFSFCVQLLKAFGYVESENDIYNFDSIISAQYTDIFNGAFSVYQEARFSNHNISDSQNELLNLCVKETVKEIKEKRNIFQQFNDKYISCVYK